MPFWKNCRKAVLFFVAAAVLFGCATREQAIIGVENAKIPATSVTGTKSHQIFVVTTRQRTAEANILFSGERSDTLGFARVTVTLPPDHQRGQIERPKRLPPNPNKEMTVIDPTVFTDDTQFVRDVNRAMRENGASGRSMLVFVHGYNTTFTDAVLRLGQFVEDSGFEGIPVLFSWASAGKLVDYVYDLNSTLSARNDMVVASDVLARTNTDGINIVAHSMGNFMTVEAMKLARTQNRFDSTGKLKNIILASADIDVDVFKDQMSVFDPSERRFYVLISEDDKALATSRFLARGVNRVGDSDARALDALGVTVIDLTTVQDTESTNHSKFANSPAVVQVIGGEMLQGDSLHSGTEAPGALASAFFNITDQAASAIGLNQ